MKITTKLFRNICKELIIKDTIKNSKEYDWIDIVGIPQKPKVIKNVLFFSTYTEKDGWTEGFNRKPYAKNICDKNNWDLVTDDEVNGNSIQVTSIDACIELLFNYVKLQTNPVVIGVTGSVGKTTTIAFLEQLLKADKRKVLRFYSKRLTPTSVKCHYINRINRDTEYIVMEYSAYFPSHVKELAQILPPKLSFLLNVYETHINPDSFKNKEEIVISKLNIKLDKEENSLFVSEDIVIPKGNKKIFTYFKTIHEHPKARFLPPTKRTSEIYTVGLKISELLSVNQRLLDKVFINFKPKENRIITCYLKDQKIFFHGETSGGSRLKSYFESNLNPWFFVEELDFADEDPHGFIILLKEIFSKEKVFVLDSLENRGKLSLIDSANFLSKNLFFEKLLQSSDYIVYHKALSVRDENFNPQEYLNKILIDYSIENPT